MYLLRRRKSKDFDSIQTNSNDIAAYLLTDRRLFIKKNHENTLKIKSDGLKWQTESVTFDNWWKATLNKADKDEVHLEFSHPSIALIILN